MPRKHRVFLSFAGSDRKMAQRLCQDLRGHGVDAFVDYESIAPGENFVLAINQALTQSDYYVLVWSRSCVDRSWVDAEWSAAFARELREKRSFLFIVRLDTTPLPPLLAPRQHLDAFDDWDEMVNGLAAAWHQDRAIGELVLPAPCSALMDDDEATVLLYVRNRALSVAHVMAVPAGSTGQRLLGLVRAALALPDIETKFNGSVGMRFDYQLENSGAPIPMNDEPLSELGITDGATIDLEVQVSTFGPDGSSPAISYRGESAGLSPALTRTLVNSAFAHLIPW